jgi:predicted adenine nucleotide alpha hydrolase (AANH) superfamily ATPase
MRLLMHICCANCSLHPVKSLRSKGIEATGLWFNPNIHPIEEYKRRLDTLRRLQDLWDFDVEYIDHYGLRDFVPAIAGHKEQRCFFCYSMRLEETAKIARKMNLDGFTTTLLVSPYQQFDTILSIGREMEKRYSIPFYEEDFRTGYKGSIGLSRELNLYRQNYCGCIFSLRERLEKKKVAGG